MTYGTTDVLPGTTYFLDALSAEIAQQRFRSTACADTMKKEAFQANKQAMSFFQASKWDLAQGWFQLGYIYNFFSGTPVDCASSAYNAAATHVRMVRDEHAIFWAKKALEFDNNHQKALKLIERLTQTSFGL